MNRDLCRRALIGVLILLLVQIPRSILLLGSKDMIGAAAQTSKQKGMSYASWWHGQYSHPDADLALIKLAETGVNWISLIVTWYQDDVTSATIYADSLKTPTNDDLVHAIAYAHSLGFKVMLKPHLDLSNDPNPMHWRGMIGWDFTEAKWDEWFASYQAFIEHYAQLAEENGVEQFCVGTELSVSQEQAARWRAVVADVKSLYGGPLAYAANWDAADLTWWDAVEYIGIDAYYSLTGKCDPTVEELMAGWAPHVEALAALADQWDKSILFTEIGYRSVDCANRRPWEWGTGGIVDLEEQADAYEAAFASVFNQDWFAGIFWWVWDTDAFQGGPCYDGYTPHDKPAEDVLRRWYGVAPRSGRATPIPDYGRVLNLYTDELGPGWQDWSWDATVDLVSSSPVYSGTHAISVTAQAWGALSLHHEGFASDPYHWLELYVRKSFEEQPLKVYFSDGSGQELLYITLDDCRYTAGNVVEPHMWTRVLVPLSDLDAAGKWLSRMSIKNYQEQPAEFWIDEVHLVGALWPVYLPLAMSEDP